MLHKKMALPATILLIIFSLIAVACSPSTPAPTQAPEVQIPSPQPEAQQTSPMVQPTPLPSIAEEDQPIVVRVGMTPFFDYQFLAWLKNLAGIQN
jgi:hypothetical protein